MNYEETASALANRILDLIPNHPSILDINDPWELLEIEGFNCSDLKPSLHQARWALRQAKEEYINKKLDK